MASKYLKNSEGIVRAITSDNLQLEKPLLNENYDIEVHNRNMDKIDNAIQEVKGKVDGLELTAQRVSIADSTNKFEATNVEDALLENKTSILKNTNLANQALNKANEAFQRGDNVKTQLVDKLISEGLDVSTNNSFEELIESIALGKKWASGTVGVNSPYAGNYYKRNGKATTGNCYYVTVNNLEFDPTRVLLVGTESNYTSSISVFDKEYDNNSCSVATCSGINSTTVGYNVMVNHNTLNVGFGTSFGSFMLPVTANTTYSWIAFE